MLLSTIAPGHNLLWLRVPEAELTTAAVKAQVAKYLGFVLDELGFPQSQLTPVYKDNDSMIKIVNPIYRTDRS